jgi:predicted phosphodiesterase
VTEELKKKLKILIGKKKSFEEICEMLELKDYEILGLMELLKQDGELIDYVNGEILKIKKPIQKDETYQIPTNTKHIKLLFISDTHLACKHDRLDILKYLYNKAEENGTNAVLHCGDILDGCYTNRPQQIYELKCHGFDEHLKYVVDNYPKSELKTYFIGGNHLDTYIRNGGSDMGKAISKEREDLIYLNPDTAKIKFGNLGILMHHGSGGKAYSISYKLQKYVETIDDPEIKIIMQGHFHNSMYMYYMGKHCFQVGALVDENNWSRSLGLKNEKSCYWVDVDYDKKGNPIIITPTLETFEKGKIR